MLKISSDYNGYIEEITNNDENKINNKSNTNEIDDNKLEISKPNS